MYLIYLCSFVYLAFNLISINSQGLRSFNRRQNVFNLIKKHKYDVIFLQETHWTAELQTDILREWEGKILFNNFDSTPRSTAILFHPNFIFKHHNNSCDSQGRTQQSLIEHADRKFNLVNIYAPRTDTDRKNYFITIPAYISSTEENILGGDFNCISDKKLDKLGGNPLARQTAMTILNTITLQNNLVDIWRDQHRDVRKFTWTGKNPHDNSYIHTRIDKFYVTTTLANVITTTDIIPFPFSDHDAILLTINLQQHQRRNGYWHFNNSLLNDHTFNAEINNFWNTWLTKKNTFPNLLQWWDKAKYHFKNISIQRSTTLRKIERNERRRLEIKIQKLQNNIANGNDHDTKAYLQAKTELQRLHQKDLDALKIRTQIQYAEEGEKSTRYFYSLERQHQTKQTINVLTKDNLDTITEPNDLITETHNFYKHLYSSEPIDQHQQDAFLQINTPILSPDERNICEGHVTEHELNKALLSMENNKSPGLDGLTTNFYKHFWHILGPYLTNILNSAYENGSLALSQRRGLISLLFKKGDRTKLKNWRPITLLNTDYKILTKALANRLQQTLPLLIHTDQTACIPGRTINDNLRLIQDAIHYANETQTPLALISVDQLKAFDRVSHTYLFKVLRHFGFGPSFLRWIEILYTETMSSVKINGWMTAFIPIQRGLRQGCALSMPLYVLTAELLATHIRTHQGVKGFQHPQATPKISQYADDTTLLLANDNSITNAFQIFQAYEAASGARINLQKCKGLWSGSYRARTDSPTPFEWTNTSLPDKLLGLYVGNTDCTNQNLESKIHKLRNITAAWRHRDLSLKGRALVINGLLTSTLWYLATNIHFPAWAIQEIEDIVYSFLWDFKPPLLNRDVLSLPIAEGGLNLPRITDKVHALRLNTLKRLLTPDQAYWKIFTSHFLRLTHMPLGKYTLALNYTLHHIDRHIPPFHRELLTAWHTHADYHQRIYPPITLPIILKEPLFHNPLISANNAPLLYSDWIKAGVLSIEDICYSVIPGFLPPLAVHELLTQNDENTTRTLQRTTRELTQIQQALPTHWTRLLHGQNTTQRPTLQPLFAIPTTDPNKPADPLDNYKTKHFCLQLQQLRQIQPPAMNHWRQILRQDPHFNTTFWKTIYPKLATNKQGDVNWKIAHRILPTALSLHRAIVYNTPHCPHCQTNENIEHLFIHCQFTQTFWTNIQNYINKMTHSTLRLTDNIKLFGLTRHNTTIHDTDTLNLLNWTLTIARCAIHKSAVEYRTKQIHTSPDDLFLASVKTHLKFQHKYYTMQDKEADFISIWCIGSALASINNHKLIFHL